MGTLQIGAENAPSDQAAVTSANGGGVSPFTGTTVLFSSASAYNGAFGYATTSGVLQTSAMAQVGAAGNTMRSRVYFRYAARPVGNLERIIAVTNNNGVVLFGVRIQSTGTLVLEDGAGGTPFVGSLVTQPNTWYRIEFCWAPSNTVTGANSKVMLWCGPATATAAATNSTTQSYFYSTTFQSATNASAVVPGIGWFRMEGITTATDFDDLAVDNGTFTNVPSTWWGKSTTVQAAGVVMSTPGGRLVINNATSLPVQYSTVPYAALARFNLAADLLQSRVLAVRGIPGLAVLGEIGVQRALALAAVSSMSLAPDPLLHPFVWRADADDETLAINNGWKSSTSVLLAQVLARLSASGYRVTTGAWVSAASSGALYGPSVDVRGVLAMEAGAQLIMATSDLYIDTWRTWVNARMELPGERLVLQTFTPAGVGALTLAGWRLTSNALLMNSPPRLVVNGLKNQSRAWQADALARLILTGRLQHQRWVTMSAIGQMLVEGRILRDQMILDQVFARVLGRGYRADLFYTARRAALLASRHPVKLFPQTGRADLDASLRIAQLFDNGLRTVVLDNLRADSDLFADSQEALLLPNGANAVITD